MREREQPAGVRGREKAVMMGIEEADQLDTWVGEAESGGAGNGGNGENDVTVCAQVLSGYQQARVDVLSSQSYLIKLPEKPDIQRPGSKGKPSGKWHSLAKRLGVDVIKNEAK